MPKDTFPDLIMFGNIDLNKLKKYKNPDGTYSSVRSGTFGIEENGKEITVVLPTLINGKQVSAEEALNHYLRTGEHLGKFGSEESANKFSKMLSAYMGSEKGKLSYNHFRRK
jgi:hypothetical protein